LTCLKWWICKSVGSRFVHKWEELSVFILHHLCHCLVKEIVSWIPWLTSVLSWCWSSLNWRWIMILKFGCFNESFVAARREVVSGRTLIHYYGVIGWLLESIHAGTKSALVMGFIWHLSWLTWFLWTAIVKIGWLLILIRLVELKLVLIVVLNVNILCNIFNLVDFVMISLVIVVVSNFRIIHYSGRYLWLSIVLFKSIEHFWLLHIMEGWFFISNDFLASSQGFISFLNAFFLYWNSLFCSFSVLFLNFGSELWSVFFFMINNENWLLLNFRFNLVIFGHILDSNGFINNWFED